VEVVVYEVVQMAMEESHVEKPKRKNLVGWMWGMMGGKEDKEIEEGNVNVPNEEVLEREEEVPPAPGGI